MEQKTIKLELKGIDFKDTDFMDNKDCAMSKAVKRQLNTSDVESGVKNAFINGITYSINRNYGCYEFELDEQQAASNGYSEDEVIRTLTLTKVKN